MTGGLKEGRFAGHPVHTMLIHFPAGLFPAAVLFDTLGAVTGMVMFHTVSLCCLAAGAGLGALAAGFGFLDLIGNGGTEAFRTAWRHGLLEAGSLTLFVTLALLRFRHWPEAAVPGTLEWMLAGGGLALLLAGNWFGGELVFRHGVGTRRDQP